MFYFSYPVGLDLETVDGTTVLGKLDLKWQSVGGSNNYNSSLEIQLVTLNVVTVITSSN